MTDVWESTALGPNVETAVRRAIMATLDEVAVDWIYVPNEDRDEIAKRLRTIASQIRTRRFAPDKRPLL